MVISSSTQVEMYNYLAENKESNIREIDNDSNDLISNSIKILATKLSRLSTLFVSTTIIRNDGKRALITKNFKAETNHLIYYVLYNIGGCEAILKEVGKNKALTDNFKELPIDYSNLKDIGNKLRNKLINLCKLYLDNKEYGLAAKDKTDDKGFLVKESWLAEAVLHKYTGELGYKLLDNNIRARTEATMGLRTDILIEHPLKYIIGDIKIYSNLITKTGVYAINENINQVNTYVGVCKNKYSADIVEGIIIHIVSSEQYEKCKHLSGLEIGFENTRSIKIYIIEDKGLDYIFSEYKKIIEDNL